MCTACWVEAGSPVVVNLKTKELVRLLEWLYEVQLAGGECHICTGDYNMDDDSVQRLREHLLTVEVETEVETLVAAHLGTMTEDERYSAMHEFWEGPHALPCPP